VRRFQSQRPIAHPFSHSLATSFFAALRQDPDAADAPLIAIPAAHLLLRPNATRLRYYSDVHSLRCQISALSDLGTSAQTGPSPPGSDSAPRMMNDEAILHQWVLLGEQYLRADPQKYPPVRSMGPGVRQDLLSM
jgi:hypothetical protein